MLTGGSRTPARVVAARSGLFSSGELLRGVCKGELHRARLGVRREEGRAWMGLRGNCTARDWEYAERRAEYGWGWEELHRARLGGRREEGGVWMGLVRVAPREIGRTQRGRRGMDGAGKKLHRARLGVRREEGGVWMGLGKRLPFVGQAQAAWDTRPTLRARNQHEDRLVCCRYVG